MGILITWPVQRKRRPASVSRDGDAMILFFTGVRYVRDPETIDTVAPQIAGSVGGKDAQAVAAM